MRRILTLLMVSISTILLSQNFNLKFDKKVNFIIDDSVTIQDENTSVKIFNDFVNKNNITRYDILHVGTNGCCNRFEIGVIKSKYSEWRITKFETKINENWIIKELRIEK